MDTIKNNFSIKDLENITGVKAHTIRIWEKRYDLLSPERSETNIRYYSNKNLQKLLNIVLLNNNNYKISKISEMKDDEISFTARELVLDRAINEEAINSLKLAMFQFDKTLFNNIYSRLLLKKTFKEIFKEIFIPFLEHVGLLWQTETILPAHEHFVSNLISQKVQVNTEELKYTTIISDTTYVLFLPENEIHELGLLYLNYELVLRGYKTIYLGQNLPIDNLNYFFGIGKNVCFIKSKPLAASAFLTFIALLYVRHSLIGLLSIFRDVTALSGGAMTCDEKLTSLSSSLVQRGSACCWKKCR